ncbi:MAG: hypothetical protein NUW37_08860 [Planctomycetes bacterium]|nr:hypothetical protein [Planctomycetota bacterium]
MERERISNLLEEHKEALKSGDFARADAIQREVSSDADAKDILGDRIAALKDVASRMKLLAPYKDAMKSFATELSSKVSALQEDLKSKADALEDSAKELDALRTEKSKSDERLAENNRHIHDLQIVVEKRDERIQKLVEQVVTLSKFRDAYKAQRPVVASLFDEVKTLRRNAESSAGHGGGNGTEDSARMNDRLEKARRKNDKLQEQLDSEKRKHSKRRKELIRELEEMKSDATAAKTHSEDLLNIVARLQSGLGERIAYVEDRLIGVMELKGPKRAKELQKVKAEASALREDIASIAKKSAEIDAKGSSETASLAGSDEKPPKKKAKKKKSGKKKASGKEPAAVKVEGAVASKKAHEAHEKKAAKNREKKKDRKGESKKPVENAGKTKAGAGEKSGAKSSAKKGAPSKKKSKK